MSLNTPWARDLPRIANKGISQSESGRSCKPPTPERVNNSEKLPYNREHEGETCYSFRRVVRENRAHCLRARLRPR
jgi:hypothetical protein